MTQMNNRSNIRYLLTTTLLLAAIYLQGQSIPLTVIGHPDGAPASMNQAELKSILLGEKQRWRNGKKIEVALLKTNSTTGKYVCEHVYKMSADEFKKYWLSLVFQGKAEAPAFFNSAQELQTFVAENPGAIGIIEETTAAANTQVIMIDGKKTL